LSPLFFTFPPHLARVLQMAASSTPAMWTSKLGSKYPKDQIERLDSEHHRLLQRLRKETHNARCAECGEGNTAWASVSLGIFLCVRCSDVHRALGTHISKTKGCSGTYLWGPDEIAVMQEVGNANAAALYGIDAPTPAASASKEERIELCRQKYEQRLWAPAKATALPARGGKAAVVPGAPAEQSVVVSASPPQKSEARAPFPRPEMALPTPVRAPARVQSVAKTMDLINFDALFADLESDGAATKPQTQQGEQRQPESTNQVAALEPGDTGLDAFLTQCLKNTAVATKPEASAPLVPSLQRAVSPSVWENFGAW